jgi:hypothetical protein
MFMHDPPNALGVVMASSGHRRTVTREDAEREARTEMETDGYAVASVEEVVLFSHTAEIVNFGGCFCEDPEASWCGDGDGKAWRRVLVLTIDRLTERRRQ